MYDYDKVEDIYQDEIANTLKMPQRFVGKILMLKHGKSKTIFKPNSQMSSDRQGLLFSGYVFIAANYAATIAINENNVVIASSKSVYLSPSKSNEIIIFDARVKNKEAKQRVVKVVGNQKGIEIFEAEFLIKEDRNLANG